MSFFDDTSAIGTRIIKANKCNVGTTFKIIIGLDLSVTGNPSNVLKVKFGNTTILTSTTTLGNHTNDFAKIECDLTIKSIVASGTATLSGFTYVAGTTDISRNLLVSTSVTIDTTVDNLLDITYQVGNTLCTIKTINSFIYRIN